MGVQVEVDILLPPDSLQLLLILVVALGARVVNLFLGVLLDNLQDTLTPLCFRVFVGLVESPVPYRAKLVQHLAQVRIRGLEDQPR